MHQLVHEDAIGIVSPIPRVKHGLYYKGKVNPRAKAPATCSTEG